MLSTTAATKTGFTGPFVKSALMAPLMALAILVSSNPFFYTRHMVSSSESSSVMLPAHDARSSVSSSVMSPAHNARSRELLDPLGRPNPICRSQYRTKGTSRGSPLIFQRDDLMVCQTPKIGTTELRCIQNYYDAERTFHDTLPDGRNCHPRYVKALAQLRDIKDEATFQDYLFSEEVTRIMFVRHPVRRILSGFLQVSIAQESDRFWRRYEFEEDLGYGPEAFRTWIMNSTFMFQYDGTCSHASTYMSLEPWFQHYAPPQHCRCGIWDCGVQWKAYKIEEESVASVLKQYIPGKWIPSDIELRVNNKKYDEWEYLTPDVLKVLNHLTRDEQEFFGYKPLTFEGDTIV